MVTSSPTKHLNWLIEVAEMRKKESQFGTFQEILLELESELLNCEEELDDQLFCEVAFYLGRNFEEMGFLAKAMELFEQASLFAPEVSVIEEKALVREVRLKSFLGRTSDMEGPYAYLKNFDAEESIDYLSACGFAELALGRLSEAMPFFERALHSSGSSTQEKRNLFFQLIEQELFHGHNFSKLVRLSDLTFFDNLSAYEQTLIFVLSRDREALGYLGPIWFSRMNPSESLKASFLISQVKDFQLAWCYKPLFFQSLSQFDHATQIFWRHFFEHSTAAHKVMAS